jgi:hypothetical protein
MAVGTPALVGGQHVVIRLEISPHASAVLFVSCKLQVYYVRHNLMHLLTLMHLRGTKIKPVAAADCY